MKDLLCFILLCGYVCCGLHGQDSDLLIKEIYVQNFETLDTLETPLYGSKTIYAYNEKGLLISQ